MSADKLLPAILISAFTRAQAHRAVALLRSYLEQRFYESSPATDPAAYFLTHKLNKEDAALVSAWPPEIYKFFTSAELLYPTLHALNTSLESLPKLGLYLPFVPTLTDLTRYGTWLRTRIDPQLLIEIHYDPRVFGGCGVVWRGVRHDLSLGYRIQAHREQILKFIEHYAQL